MDAYLEEELYDLLTYCIQNPDASDLAGKKGRVQEIGRELYADGGADAAEDGSSGSALDDPFADPLA